MAVSVSTAKEEFVGMAVSVSTAKEEVVGVLVQKIYKEFKDFDVDEFNHFNISEIVKGGSLGHGTVIFSDFDVDLVIYSRSISGADVLEKGQHLFTDWLIQLENFLQKAFGGECTGLMHTKRSVQFRFRDIIDVDLLISPYWSDNPQTDTEQDPDAFYNFLEKITGKNEKKRRNKRNRFTVGASKWQVQFFKDQKPQVKELIRKAKQWRNEQWPEGGQGSGRPSSYLMSLLVVAAYEGRPDNVTEEIKALVKEGDDGSLDIYWTDFYERREVFKLLPARPRIVDPANPANNVWVTGLHSYRPGKKNSNYEPGNGEAHDLISKIDTINLS